jgi:AcrR family transcriptional regulator
MKTPRIDVGSIRREQIVQAAVSIIAEQGLQNLSLSEIEKKAGMSRGQLTYYFPTKEDILLAVFDLLIRMMHERAGRGFEAEGGHCGPHGAGWARVEFLLRKLLLEPPAVPAFGPLQYTFLSQMGHREDFRQRLANLYEEWRGHMAKDLAPDLQRKPGKKASPRALATLVQAILHGLFVQRAADPDSYDRKEVLDLCLDMLGGYLRPGETTDLKLPRRASRRPAANGDAHDHARAKQ